MKCYFKLLKGHPRSPRYNLEIDKLHSVSRVCESLNNSIYYCGYYNDVFHYISTINVNLNIVW